jgi:hypothetical protein
MIEMPSSEMLLVMERVPAPLARLPGGLPVRAVPLTTMFEAVAASCMAWRP